MSIEKPLVYLAGSLRNPAIVSLHRRLEELVPDCDFFSDWAAAHEAGDDAWKEYEQARGFTFLEALDRPAARHVFEFDKRNIDRSDVLVLVLPAGRSAHMELGYAIGRGKVGFILLDPSSETDRWDVMYCFAHGVYADVEDLATALRDGC